MRVMLFSDTYAPQINGVATSTASLARALSEDGHAVMVCTVGGRRREGGDEPFVVARAGSVPLPLYGEFSVASPMGGGFGRLVAGFRPDVIHCHTPFSIGWQGARAAHAAAIPLVGTHHTLFGAYVAAYSRLGQQVNQRLAGLIRRYIATFYNQCDSVMCASHYLASDLVSSGLARPLAIVPNALDTERFHPLAPGEATRKTGRRLISVGRLAPEKNLPRLLRLVAPVLRRDPRVTLTIAGAGPVGQRLVSLARELGIARQVHFLGMLRGPELREQLAASDICVCASLTENQPMALLESLACGVPVVALAAAGVPEIIADGRTGYLVAPECADTEFARRLAALMADAAARQRMSTQAVASAQAYSRAACLGLTLTIYKAAQAHAARSTTSATHARRKLKSVGMDA
ncbi:MAG: glycosyltransferase [Ktedonobacterales bacterium]